MAKQFHFKQFSLHLCPDVFPLGTDACLLGACAGADMPSPARILDIGTGTGVVALMLAQRFDKSIVRGLDIHPAAARCASENFAGSPWSGRLQTLCVSVQSFAGTQPAGSQDLIVSNPPFFEGLTPSPDPMRQLSRHNAALPDPEFMAAIRHLIHPVHGQAWVILPRDRAALWCQKLPQHGLFPAFCCYVRRHPRLPYKRCLLAIRPWAGPCAHAYHTLNANTKTNSYTAATKKLWQDFYLHL
ncbi:MAG: tRNA1(Val) (adenine(37)-N6)-methyltransferase [Bernardetiaceae bacterium]